jgi:hypothetical protein
MMSITFHKPDGTPADPAPAGMAIAPVKKMGPPVRHAIPRAREIPKAENLEGISQLPKTEDSVTSAAPVISPSPAVAKVNFPSSSQLAVDRSKVEVALAAQPEISQGIHVPNFATPPKSAPAPFEVKSFASKKSAPK